MIMSKDQALAGSDVNGLLNLKKKVFRQWTTYCRTSELTFHLFILYNHEKAEGKQLGIMFAFCGEERDLERFEPFLKGLSLSQAERVESQSFTAACTLMKRERKIIFEPNENAPAQQGEALYFVSPWETNEDAHLIDMIHTMKSLSEDSAYRVDIFPTLKEKTVDAFREAFAALLQRVGYSDGEREVLMQYVFGLWTIYSHSFFQANIYAFGSNARDAQLLLHAAASEALQKGEYTVLDVSSDGIDAAPDKRYPSNFGLFHGFPFEADPKAIYYTSEDFPNPIKFWPTLFAPEEMEPFFPFSPENFAEIYTRKSVSS